jgi:hypothetical protein
LALLLFVDGAPPFLEELEIDAAGGARNDVNDDDEARDLPRINRKESGMSGMG